MKLFPAFCLFVVASWSSAASAASFLVDPIHGNDTAAGTPGAPFRTIARAVKEVDGVGGEIDLDPKAGPYTESIVVKKGGQPGNPLVIDGHGAVVNLGVDMTAGPWTDLGDGFRLERPVIQQTRINLVTVAYVNGLAVFSNDPRGIRPPAWHGGSVRYDEQNRLILVYPKGLSPANAVVVLTGGPQFMSCGVQIQGASYVTIRNITSAFSANDGFNFHGKGHDIVVENVKGLFNGDQGTSAHETYQVNVSHSEFAFNGSGDGTVEDVQEAMTNYTDVRVHQNRAAGFLFQQGHHVLTRAVSFGNGTSNFPKPNEHLEMIDCTDEGQVGKDKEIPVVADPKVPGDPSKQLQETDRLGRFLQLRPPASSTFPAPTPARASSPKPAS